MNIQILVDNNNSWIVPFAQELNQKLIALKHQSEFIQTQEQIRAGDVLFLLSCEKIIRPEALALHRHNLVVHESALPQGRGWSPLTWQVLAGSSQIPITLLEAAAKVDSGPIYLQDLIELEGHELIEEMRQKQGIKTIELALRFVAGAAELKAREQTGESSYYARRTAQNSELDPQKTIQEQFNLLRVCDNERYPAFFRLNGKKYTLKIEKADENKDEEN